MGLKPLKEKQREALEAFTSGHDTFVALPNYLTTFPEAEISQKATQPISAYHAQVSVKVEALNVTCNQLTPNKICWPETE